MPSGEGPYFEQDDTLDFIESVARQKSLVIYVGAGVSIDRTGLQWEHLIGKLMAKKVTNDEVRARLLSDSPLQSASIAKQMYINEAKDLKGANIQIGRDVQSSLYTEQWRRADIARSVMKLVAELKRERKTFYIITTNYDDCLQQELKLLNGERRKRREEPVMLTTVVSRPQVRIDQIDKEVHRVVGDDRIVHIHGYIPEEGGRPDPITLSEVDYAKAYPLSSKILERLFRQNSVLILGSSLTDPPLLNALATTASTRGTRSRQRFAVMPIQGFRLPLELQKEIRENVVSRMKHFDVRVTFPDYFSEVAQFITEVRVCSQQGRFAGPFRISRKRPGDRLRDWWTSWVDARKDDWAAANQRDHLLLSECVDGLKHRLQSQVRDVEVEIWVRWKPDADGTQLRLWASSKAAWPEVDARTAKVGNGSAYLSVRTFTLGRVEIYPPDPSAERRQRRYLCVPIKSREPQQEELLTAVISFAYRLDNGTNDKDLVLVDKMKVVGQLTMYGAKIVDAQPGQLRRD